MTLNRGGLTVMDSGIGLQYVGCFIPGIDGTVEIIMAKIRNKSYSLKGETSVATLDFFLLKLNF